MTNLSLKRMCGVVAMAGIAACAASSKAGADPQMSLKDKQQWDEIKKEISAKAAQASEKCGVTLEAYVDVASFAGQDPFTQSPTAYCRDFIDNVKSVCSASELGKGAVQKSASKITCKKSTDGTKATRSGKELVVQIDHKKTEIIGSSWKSVLEDILVATPPAGGGDQDMALKDRLAWAEMLHNIEQNAKDASQKCDVKIAVSYDVASFKGVDLFRQSPSAVCRDVVNNVGALCASPVGKKTVQSEVQSITCKRSSDGTKVTRQGSAVTVGFDANNKSITGKKTGSYSWKSALEEIL